ncbi:hypothetical protein [Variovorax sp. RA8]|uniref:hypothetical protein n=1 Tax=Variovorax sp. (strain JCM 16519 / RA8) TaxID=662548 RepID=UPI0013A5909D|nr:hypothetical protein [Variovorax sp. RA8]
MIDRRHFNLGLGGLAPVWGAGVSAQGRKVFRGANSARSPSPHCSRTPTSARRSASTGRSIRRPSRRTSRTPRAARRSSCFSAGARTTGSAARTIPDLRWGASRQEEWQQIVAITASSTANPQLPQQLGDLRNVFTNELIDEINAFDKAAVVRQAQEFRLA